MIGGGRRLTRERIPRTLTEAADCGSRRACSCRKTCIALSFNGRTSDSDSLDRGSNPWGATNTISAAVSVTGFESLGGNQRHYSVWARKRGNCPVDGIRLPPVRALNRRKRELSNVLLDCLLGSRPVAEQKSSQVFHFSRHILAQVVRYNQSQRFSRDIELDRQRILAQLKLTQFRRER